MLLRAALSEELERQEEGAGEGDATVDEETTV